MIEHSPKILASKGKATTTIKCFVYGVNRDCGACGHLSLPAWLQDCTWSQSVEGESKMLLLFERYFEQCCTAVSVCLLFVGRSELIFVCKYAVRMLDRKFCFCVMERFCPQTVSHCFLTSAHS